MEVTPNSSLLGRAPVPNTTLTWPFVNATAAGARARCACACGAACGVEGSCSCCESLCAAAARTRRLLDTPPPRLALFDASRGARPLPPLAPVDMGFLTNSVPIAGPLIDKMTSPPWVFVLGVMMLSAAHSVNLPYRKPDNAMGGFCTAMLGLIGSLGLVALYGANVNAMRMVLEFFDSDMQIRA